MSPKKPAKRPRSPRTRVAEADVPVVDRPNDAGLPGRPRPLPAHFGRPPRPAPHPIDGLPHKLPHRIPRPIPPRPRRPPGLRVIRLQFIATTASIQYNPALLTPVVTAMNAFFQPGRIEFVYDPQADFAVEDNTLLDQDWELIDAGSLSNPQTIEPAVDSSRFQAERQRVARQHLGKLVVYISLGSQLTFQNGTWVIQERGYHYSSVSAEYVATAAVYWRTPNGSIDPQTLAHEIGHYLHLQHTMGSMPDTVAAAATILKDAVDRWGVDVNEALRVFDADLPFIVDTPPDAGPTLFTNANGSACGAPDFVDVPVTFASGATRTYRIEPDRRLLMSYFKGCPQADRFSPQQFVRMRVALEHGNRNHLVTRASTWVARRPAVCSIAGTPSVVMQDCTSSPWFGEWTGESFALRPRWEWLGGYVEELSVVAGAGGEIDLVARDFDGQAFHKAFRGGVWAPALGWNALTSRRFAWGPVVASSAPGTLDAFAVAADGTLWWAANSNGMWGTWRSIATQCMGAPAVVPPQPFRLDVVVWKDDRSLAHATLNAGTWSAWQPIAGEVAAPPSMASWGFGRLDLVVRGTDNAIYHQWFDGGAWNGWWEYQGGTFTGQPIVLAPMLNTLDIVARDGDGHVWHKAWLGNSWTPSLTQWRSLGGEIVDSPAITASVVPGGRRLDVFGRARDGALLHCQLDPDGTQRPAPLAFTREDALTEY